MIYMFLSNNPSSGDIDSSNLPCLWCYSRVHVIVLLRPIMLLAFTKKKYRLTPDYLFAFFSIHHLLLKRKKNSQAYFVLSDTVCKGWCVVKAHCQTMQTSTERLRFFEIQQLICLFGVSLSTFFQLCRRLLCLSKGYNAVALVRA